MKALKYTYKTIIKLTISLIRLTYLIPVLLLGLILYPITLISKRIGYNLGLVLGVIRIFDINMLACMHELTNKKNNDKN